VDWLEEARRSVSTRLRIVRRELLESQTAARSDEPALRTSSDFLGISDHWQTFKDEHNINNI
jgi:hypothetical protein